MSYELIVAGIDQEIAKLRQARELVASASKRDGLGVVKPTKPVKPAKKKRRISAEGKARIIAAQKARWAKSKAKK